jgi:hypothetical protein
MFNTDSIKNYAVQAVTDFVSNGTSLSQGIAKIASAEELNPEQIKRVVEASNTIAHLKLLSSSSDRIFEFPVAKYEDVLGHMSTPSTPFTDPSKDVSEHSDAFGGSSHNENTKYASTRPELETYTAKAIIATKAYIEKLAYDKQEKMLEIEDSIKRLQKQDHPMEKFAEVCGEAEFGMVFGMEKSANLNTKLVFEDKELGEARKLVGLIKEARELIKIAEEARGFVERGSETLGKALGSGASKPFKAVGRGLAYAGRETGELARSAVTGKPSSEAAQRFAKNVGRVTSTTMNLGLGAAFTEHKNGSVWKNLQG